MSGTGTSSSSRRLTPAAKIFAVATTFIDQTIVSVAAPNTQAELGLSSAGAWSSRNCPRTSGS
ncbi:hypothetical protein ACQ86D_49935 [Streptomyces galilaeus]